ncbi:MAG: phage holin family protein [Candidatus Dormibacteria bacterium]
MVRSDPSEEPVAQLVHELGDDVRQLAADELALVKAELKRSARRGLRVAIAAVVAGIGFSLFGIFALVTLVEWIPNHTLAAAMVAVAGLVLLLAGAAMVWANRHLWPFTDSKQSLIEDLEWARRQSKRAHR